MRSNGSADHRSDDQAQAERYTKHKREAEGFAGADITRRCENDHWNEHRRVSEKAREDAGGQRRAAACEIGAEAASCQQPECRSKEGAERVVESRRRGPNVRSRVRP